MIVEIQCLPDPLGTTEQPYAHVDAAIAVAQAAGCRMEVGALGTTIEGAPDDVWRVVRAMHEACLTAGAGAVVSIVKLAQHRDEAGGPTIDGLTGKFRS